MTRFRVKGPRKPRRIRRDRMGRFARAGVVGTVGGANRINSVGAARKRAWVKQPKGIRRSDALAAANRSWPTTATKQQVAAAKKKGWKDNPRHIVPYSRTSMRAQTVGVNVGHRISPGLKMSYGTFVRVERINPSKLEKKIQAKDEEFLNRTARKFSPHEKLDPYYKQGIRNFRRNLLDTFVGHEQKIGKKSYASLATDMNAMPTLLIRKNRRSYQGNRRKALYAYNDMVQKNKLEGMKTGEFRPSRRKKRRS